MKTSEMIRIAIASEILDIAAKCENRQELLDKIDYLRPMFRRMEKSEIDEIDSSDYVRKFEGDKCTEDLESAKE